MEPAPTPATLAGQAIALACPSCLRPLNDGASAFHCPTCRRDWPVLDGIPLFGQPAFWSKLSQDQTAALLARAPEIGFREALLQVLDSVADRRDRLATYEYATDPNRACGLFLCPLTPDSVVLDCGSGWGALTLVAAHASQAVAAMDPCLQNLQVVRLRAREAGLPNITPVLGDILAPPFPDSHFDLVVMNGVLEWVGRSQAFARPQAAQEAALLQVQRILKPGGHLYLAIENRLGFEYFLGKRDEHTDGLHFTTVLPRWAADLVSRLAGQGPYRTYTYSAGGYRRLLRRTGFQTARFYLALPDYRHPRFLIPTRDTSFQYVLDNHLRSHPKVPAPLFLLASLGARLRLHELLSPAFAIVARKAKT
jgi:ubiquinone/menaquinone biosynthesis C-methylase UbiE